MAAESPSLDFMEDLANYIPTDVLVKIIEEKTITLEQKNKELEDVKTEAAKFLEINKNKNNKGIRAGLRRRNEKIEELQENICKLETELNKNKIDLEKRKKEDEEDKENIYDEYDFMMKYYKYKAKYYNLLQKL